MWSTGSLPPGPLPSGRRSPAGRLLRVPGPGLLVEVVRQGRDHRALPEQQPSLEQQSGLVVEQVSPPMVDDELGDQDGDDVVLEARVELVDVTEDRPGDLPVRVVDDLER